MVLPLLVVLASNLLSPESLPQISIQSWAQYDDWKFDSSSPLPVVFGNTSSSVFAIPASVGGIVIQCIATYPIEWNFHPHQLGSFGAPVRGASRGAALVSSTRQSSDDIFNPSTFQFQTELKILGNSNIMTGNYTCQAVNAPEISTSIYVYWEGSSPPFLTLAGLTVSITWDNDTKQAVLPCKISRPDISVDLYQITHNDTVALESNSSIVYDSTRGFILSELPNPFGKYKCVANNEPEKDYVVNILVPNIKPQGESGNKILRPASFKFDESKSQFVCCSSQENKPPAMAHFYCEHPISCQLRKDSLIDIENSGRRSGSRCTTISLYRRIFGVVRCIGEGVDSVRTYMFPIGVPSVFGRRTAGIIDSNLTIPKPYYDWDSVDADQMMRVNQMNADDDVIYATQNYTFGCQFSVAYFSHGIRWMISWKNNTKLVLEEAIVNMTGARGFRQMFRKNEASVIVTADMELDSVTCFAPVWNTTEWRNKSIVLTVQEPVEPTVLGEEVEQFDWYLNDTKKVISCNFSGKPTPLVSWKKDNKTFTSPHVRNAKNSSIIEFTRVSYETHGEYSCIVENFKGNASKTFRVLVYEQGSGQVGVLIGVVVVGFILVVAGSAFLAWKLYNQKRIINHLAGAVFKEVHATQNGHREHVTTEEAATIGIRSNLDATGVEQEENVNGVAGKFEDGNYHKL